MKKTFLAVLACSAVLAACPAAASSVSADALESAASLSKAPANGWYEQNGSTYYYINGKKAKGLTKIGRYYYYFNTKTGARRSGLLTIRGKKYFFSSVNGVRRRGLITYKGNTYYFGKNAYAVIGHQKINGKYYFFNSKGIMLKNTWLAGKYYYGSNGVRLTGWQEIKGKQYYFDPVTGIVQKGLIKVDGSQYFFGDDGSLTTLYGLQKIGNKYYYYDEETGEMVTGWKTVGKCTWYFSRVNGAALTGWRKVGSHYYYFSSKGYLYTKRWISKKYYVNEKGARQYGWLTLDDKTYYLDPSTGVRTEGWRAISGYRYYFDQDGVMLRDTWVENHYLRPNGRMAKDMWIGPYYVNKYGIRTKDTRDPGFFTENSNTYYLDEEYAPVKGWVEDDGKLYYFDPVTGVMAKNTWIEGYYLDKNGVRVSDTLLTIDGSTYLFYEDGTKATGMVVYNEKTYYFSMSTGAMEVGLKVVGEDTYFFDQDLGGAMVVNDERYVDNAYYKFDKDGKLFSQQNIGTDEELGKAIAEFCQQFVGNPYADAGTSLTNGADCSGFTMAVFAHFGIELPHNAAQQYSVKGGQKIPVSALMPGDLIFYYKPIGHVAIYVGDIDDDGVGEVVHASNAATGIKISDYDYTVITGCARFW